MIDRYPRIYRTLHWLTALFVFILIPMGLTMADMGDTAPNKGLLYEIHKSLGILVILLVGLRLLYRFTSEIPKPLASLTRFEAFASSAMHYLLWFLLITVPLAGYIATSSCCAPLKLFNLIPVTSPFLVGEETVKGLFLFHKFGGVLMGLSALGHGAAALFHHFIKKDTVLKRML